MVNPVSALVRRVRSWFALEWVGEDDLYLQAFSEIKPTLFVGRRPSVDHLDQLRSLGVTHLVSCLPEAERSELTFLGDAFDHLFIAANDEMHQDIGDAFDTFFAYVDRARATVKTPVVLVHCEVGVSRSASLAIALVMRDEGQSFIDAFEHVRSKRVQVLPNIAFASQLQHLEWTLRPERETDRPSSLAVYLRRYCAVPTPIDELEEALRRHQHDAPAALRSIYGGEIPRVVQGTRAARH